jgi:hypothetical protein
MTKVIDTFRDYTEAPKVKHSLNCLQTALQTDFYFSALLKYDFEALFFTVITLTIFNVCVVKEVEARLKVLICTVLCWK